MEVISLWHCWGVWSPGFFDSGLQLICVFWSLVLIFLLTIPHRFSMFRSGEFAGQSSTPTSWSFNQLLVLLAVWEMKSASLKSWSAEGSMKCSKIGELCKLTSCFRGSVKLNGLRGGERDVLNPAGVALVSLEKTLLMLDWFIQLYIHFYTHVLFCNIGAVFFCTTIFSHPTFFCRHCLCCWCWHWSSPRIEKWKHKEAWNHR